MLTDESENSFQALVKKQANVMIRKFVHIYDEKLFLILVTMKQIKEHLKCYTQFHNQATAFNPFQVIGVFLYPPENIRKPLLI